MVQFAGRGGAPESVRAASHMSKIFRSEEPAAGVGGNGVPSDQKTKIRCLGYEGVAFTGYVYELLAGGKVQLNYDDETTSVIGPLQLRKRLDGHKVYEEDGRGRVLNFIRAGPPFNVVRQRAAPRTARTIPNPIPAPGL